MPSNTGGRALPSSRACGSDGCCAPAVDGGGGDGDDEDGTASDTPPPTTPLSIFLDPRIVFILFMDSDGAEKMRFVGELLPDDPPPIITDPDTLETRDVTEDRPPPASLAFEHTDAPSPKSSPTNASALDGPHPPSPSAGCIACSRSSEHGTEGVPEAGADDGRRECASDEEEFEPRATDDERAEDSGSTKKTGPVECVGEGGTDGGGLSVKRATIARESAAASSIAAHERAESERRLVTRRGPRTHTTKSLNWSYDHTPRTRARKKVTTWASRDRDPRGRHAAGAAGGHAT